MKTDVNQTLAHLGLSDEAIKIYLALLKHGKSKASNLAKAARVPRTNVYTFMEELEAVGIVQVAIEGSAKTYAPTNPEILNSIMRERLRDIEATVPLLSAQYMQTAPERPNVRFYPGVAGIKLVMEEILSNPTKQYDLFGSIHDAEFIQTVSGKFLEDWSKRRITAGVFHRNLRSRASWPKGNPPKGANPLLAGSGKHVMREIRYVPPGIRLPVLTYLYDQHVALISGVIGKQYATVMDSKDLYDNLMSLFDFLWGISEVTADGN